MDAKMIFAKKAIVRLMLDGTMAYGMLEGDVISLYDSSPFEAASPATRKSPWTRPSFWPLASLPRWLPWG